jgi:hypothetical protein
MTTKAANSPMPGSGPGWCLDPMSSVEIYLLKAPNGRLVTSLRYGKSEYAVGIVLTMICRCGADW